MQRCWIEMRFHIGRCRCILHLCSAGLDMLCLCLLCEDVRFVGVRSEGHGDVVIYGIVRAC